MKRTTITVEEHQENQEQQQKQAEEEEEEQEEQELEVEFDLFNQTTNDREAIKALVRELLPGEDGDLNGMADSIISSDVGSVVKAQGYVDALAVITILDMSDPKPWSSQIIKLTQMNEVQNSYSSSLGLIINERIVNMPTLRLAPAMHKSLFTELSERGPGSKQFSRFLMVIPFDETTSEASKASTSTERGLTTKRSKNSEFLRPEEEVYLDFAETTIKINLPNPNDGNLSDESATHPNINGSPVSRRAFAIIIDSKHIPQILQKIESLFSN